MANTQTSVPLFVANAVLTAAQQNISAATGVPVFATTVTRDAAFGGSNKALAEGQLCYLESTDVVQQYNGSSWATVGPTASGVVQVKSTSKTDTFTLSSATFTDITGLSVSITPTSASNKILVMVTVNHGSATANQFLRIMRDSTAIGIADTAGNRIRSTFATQLSYDANMYTSGAGSFLDSPATTSATTYKLQMAGALGVQTTINRSVNNTDNTTNTNTISTITVMEVTP